MTQPPPDDVAESAEQLEFLLATRVRYELNQRLPRPVQPSDACEVEAEPTDPDRDLRAAGFLLATRALRESNARAVQHRHAALSDASDEH